MGINTSQPTYKRQRFLLEFMNQVENTTSTDLQELIFLNSINENLAYYDFIPYKYGPYSFQLAEDINILQQKGYLTKNNTHICVTQKQTQNKTFFTATERGKTLIRKVYKEYPYYSINSKIIGNLFNLAELEHFENIKNEYKQIEQVLFTIGYEGKSIEDFVNKLIQNDVKLLCDVRKNPISRKFGFSKTKINYIVEEIGIKYVHISELGIESEKRANLDTTKDYQNLFREYELTLPKRKKYLDDIYSFLYENKRVALMCYEKEVEMCHRHVIRDYITSTYNVRSLDL